MIIDENKLPMYLKYLMIEYAPFLNDEIKYIVRCNRVKWEDQLSKVVDVSKISDGCNIYKLGKIRPYLNDILYNMSSDNRKELSIVYDTIIITFMKFWNLGYDRRFCFTVMMNVMKVKTMVMLITRELKMYDMEKIEMLADVIPNKLLDTDYRFLMAQCFDSILYIVKHPDSRFMIEEDIGFLCAYINRSIGPVRKDFSLVTLISMVADVLSINTSGYDPQRINIVEICDRYCSMDDIEFINNISVSRFVIDKPIFPRELLDIDTNMSHDQDDIISKTENYDTDTVTFISQDRKHALFGDNLVPEDMNLDAFINRIKSIDTKFVLKLEETIHHPSDVSDMTVTFSIPEHDKMEIMDRQSLKICVLMIMESVFFSSRIIVEYGNRLYLLYKIIGDNTIRGIGIFGENDDDGSRIRSILIIPLSGVERKLVATEIDY